MTAIAVICRVFLYIILFPRLKWIFNLLPAWRYILQCLHMFRWVLSLFPEKYSSFDRETLLDGFWYYLGILKRRSPEKGVKISELFSLGNHFINFHWALNFPFLSMQTSVITVNVNMKIVQKFCFNCFPMLYLKHLTQDYINTYVGISLNVN